MPITERLTDGTVVVSYSAEETRESARLCQEVARRMGRNIRKKNDGRSPSIHDVTFEVAWAFMYAPADKPLNESHPLWNQFFFISEWFRSLIIETLKLSPGTSWEEIYRRVGVLESSEYESEEKFWEAYHFGRMTHLTETGTDKMLDELENIHHQIVGRV